MQWDFCQSNAKIGESDISKKWPQFVKTILLYDEVTGARTNSWNLFREPGFEAAGAPRRHSPKRGYRTARIRPRSTGRKAELSATIRAFKPKKLCIQIKINSPKSTSVARAIELPSMNNTTLLRPQSPAIFRSSPSLSSRPNSALISTSPSSSLKCNTDRAGLNTAVPLWLGRAKCESKNRFLSVGIARATMVQTERGNKTEEVTWEGLESLLGGKKYGPQPRVAHLTERVFGPGNDASKLVFYRDNSAWCPYCERLWLLLEEKQLNYTVEKINMWCYGEKPEWYTKMVPSGLLPAVMLDGKLLTESLDIMLYLDSKFSEKNPMLPRPGTPQWSVLDEFLKLERKLVGAWMSRLKGRPTFQSFDSAMDTVNRALQKFEGPYFLGNEISLVDCVYAPFLERIAASMPYWPGIKVRGNERWPAVNRWYEAMDSRPAYQGIKSDDFYIVHNLEPQIGACRSEPAGAAWRAHIDGTSGSWDLPLKPELTAWGPDDGTGKNGAKEEAAQCLIKNHESVVKFALRGVKDPQPRDAEAVELGFRYVAEALLLGTENVKLPRPFPGKEAVVGAAGFLMNKLGVPRDFTYPAARQLRAYLVWLSRHCQQS
ncbi:hypothetical protein R1sor_019270 [Riccia sorocarpa]|uniref:GST N-terminal domain-containing protein n=1 Tax=Riccia sorocarpa TaxID=122646 RepID=A0ABD3IC37_9MARC